MSEKKSWDIAPRQRRSAPQAVKARPSRSMSDMKPRVKAPVVAPVPASTRNVTIARGKKPARETRAPLKKQRKAKLTVMLIGLASILFLLICASFYALWLPALRMHEVSASGPHAEDMQSIARGRLQGTHAFIVPRNSLFFIPESDIRAHILDAFPDIEAVSISAQGLNTLVLIATPRSQAFLWCGAAPDLSDGTCYETNAEGLIFARHTDVDSPSLKVYGSIEGQTGESPLRARIVYASRIPDALRFVKAMQQLNAGVIALALRGDEADLYTEGGTRITYVLGKEEQAASTAASIFPQLNVNNGSILYVDLRFEGKGYFKRAEERGE